MAGSQLDIFADTRDVVPHAAPLWLKAKRFGDARNAIEQIPSWRKIPLTVAWMTEAVWAQEGLSSAWPLIFGLAWLGGNHLHTVVRRIDDKVFRQIVAAFENADLDHPVEGGNEAAEVTDYAWLPAFALIENSAPVAALRLTHEGAKKPAERAARLVAELLHLERTGQQKQLINSRRNFRELHSGLFALYMRTR